MEIFSFLWNIISSALVFGVGAVICSKISKIFDTSATRLWCIYIWHSIFCIVYLQYVTLYGGDALRYYNDSLFKEENFAIGTEAVVSLTRIFSNYLSMSLLGIFLVFNIFGFIGLTAFDASLRYAVRNRTAGMRRLATLIVFLPSVSFWSAAVGKDSLAFMATGLALWAALNLRSRLAAMIFSVLVMLFVRPHIAAVMILAIGGSMFLQRGVSLIQRVALSAMAVVAAVFLTPFALEYAGLSAVTDAADLSNYFEIRQGYNMDGGDGDIDIANMSFPMQLFSYLFRPLPFEARSLTALAASFDNMVLFLVFVLGGWKMLTMRNRQFSENRQFLWIYSLSSWVVMALTTANLGISVRQKWMFTPMLIYLLISVIGRKRKQSAPLPLTEASDTLLPRNPTDSIHKT